VPAATAASPDTNKDLLSLTAQNDMVYFTLAESRRYGCESPVFV